MDALEALRLQVEWGADEALLAEPVCRLRAPDRQSPTPAPRRPAPQAAGEPEMVAQARAAAAACATVDELRRALLVLDPGGLATTATAFVPTDGNPASGLVFLGDVPGEEEDRSGTAFAGPAGQLLDRMLASIGLDRTTVLLTNVVPWRPPGGRPPAELEVACCLPFLHRHLQLCGATRAVALGALATRALLGSDAALAKLRGRWTPAALPGRDDALAVLPTLHPLQLLARPGLKAAAWADLRLLHRTLHRS